MAGGHRREMEELTTKKNNEIATLNARLTQVRNLNIRLFPKFWKNKTITPLITTKYIFRIFQKCISGVFKKMSCFMFRAGNL